MSEGIDPMDPGQVKSGARMNTLSVAMSDYKALWSRCQKAEAERDARAEVGYAVEARALREQLATQRKDFEARLAEAEAEREQDQKMLGQTIVELADVLASEQAVGIESVFEDFGIKLELARFRKDQEESK